MKTRKQNTIKQPVSFSGIGIHTGEKVQMRFLPAEENFGIAFKRMDLQDKPVVPATLSYVRDTKRNTTIGKDSVYIYTIEHVMAALRAMQIDNALIELSNVEPPVGNGSSDLFVDMIEEAGIEFQSKEMPFISVKEPVYYSEGDTTIIALPHSEFRISYTLNYPGNQLLKCQFYSSDITREIFKKEIAPCRTFSLYHEVSALMDAGLIKGGSLDNAVVIHGDSVYSKEGLYFPDEMVRHKVLDMIGDLGLTGCDIYGHVIAIRSGHASNFAFAKKLKELDT